MRLPLAGIPLGSRSSSEAVGCRGLYRISAPQVRQNPEPSDSPSLHFQHVISVSSRRSTMPAPVAVALVPYPESTDGRPWGQPLKQPEGAPLNLG